jgi:hypothetical protein
MVFCVYFGIYGYMNGEIANVLAPVDFEGNICGFDASTSTGDVDVIEYPYLFIWNLDAAFEDPINMFDYGICVTECPTSAEDLVICADYQDQTLYPNCSKFIGRTPIDGPMQYTYPTYPVLNYCYPSFDQLNEQD